MSDDINHRRLPPLNGLRVFEAVGRRLSMSGAARELQMTQGAVSQQVRRLECYLGLALFHRSSRGLVLTPAGQRLLAGASPGLDSIAGAMESARRTAALDSIVVSTVASLASWWLLPRLAGLESQVAGIKPRVEVSRQLTRFDADGIDLAIRHGLGQWTGVAARRLFELRVGVVSAPDAWRSSGPADWLEDPRIRFLCDPRHDYWSAWAARKGVSRARIERRALWVDDSNVLLNAAREGHGLAIVPLFLVHEQLKRRELRLWDPEILTLDGGYWLVHPPEESRAPVARLMAWLVREAARTESRVTAMIETVPSRCA